MNLNFPHPVKKIKDAEARILDAIKKGITDRDGLVKVGMNFTRNIDTSVTGVAAGMILDDLITMGVVTERLNNRFGCVEIKIAK